MINKKYFKAFTLAEILVTLSILGVVAAITIPSINRQFKQRLTITKLKKAYANLESMATNIAVNSGCIGRNLECTGLYDITDSSTYDSRNFTEKFLELAGVKGYKKVHTTAMTRVLYINCSEYSEACSYNCAFYDYFTTHDGILYSVRIAKDYYDASKKKIIVFVGTTDKRKGPSGLEDRSTFKLGRNMFLFTIYDNYIVEPVVSFTTSGAIIPASKNATNISKYCNPNGSGASQGTSCAARVIRDGWKIDY